MGQPLISKEPADFKTRFLKSLIAPWLFLVVGLLVFLSFKIQFLWVVPLVLVTAFIILNYRAMEQFLEKAELIDNSIEFTFYNSKMDKRLLKIPTSELTVEYYGNGKGFSSLVSHHMRILQNGKTIIKQYKTDEWTLRDLKETTNRINEFKR